MRRFLTVLLFGLAIIEMFLAWKLLNQVGLATEETTVLSETVNASGVLTADQAENIETTWFAAGATFGFVMCIPIVFLLALLFRRKCRQS